MVLPKTSRAHWRDASIWLIYALAGGLAPVWSGFILLRLFSRHPSWADFSQHGEFAIYSAAMFAPAFYVITRDLKVPGFVGRQFLGLITFLGMILAICFFVATSTAFMAPTPILAIDQPFLGSCTLWLFVCSAILAFVVTVLDNARMIPDVRQIAANQQERLRKEYDRLEGQP